MEATLQVVIELTCVSGVTKYYEFTIRPSSQAELLLTYDMKLQLLGTRTSVLIRSSLS